MVMDMEFVGTYMHTWIDTKCLPISLIYIYGTYYSSIFDIAILYTLSSYSYSCSALAVITGRQNIFAELCSQFPSIRP